MNLSNITIPTKLRLGFIAVILISLAVSAMVYSSATTIASASASNVRANKLKAAAHDAMTDLAIAQGAVATFVATGNAASHDRFKTAIEGFDAKIVDFGNTTKVEAQKERAAKLREIGAEYRKNAEGLVAMVQQGGRAQAQTLVAEQNAIDAVEKAGKDLLESSQERIDVRTAEQNEAYSWTVTLLIGGGIASVVLSMAMAWLMSQQIAVPVVRITDTMRRLAEGNSKAEVPDTDRKDEIGAMAGALLVFRDQAIAKEAADAAKREAEAEQKLVVDSLSDGLGRLAKGDLTPRITANFSAGYAAVKTNFNDAMNALRELIGAVSESSLQIRTGSGEIAQASEDLARRTESNAASLEETSAALTQIDGRLRASAGAASKTVERADGAIATVSSGRAVADQAVEAMGRVSESAKGIDSVIESLDKIAFQTRVLAMNAAVEAGRAGDAGRGFAVVADLVSALAMRSEEEARLAREQLTVTQTDIGAAVDAVQKVDEALSKISGDVEQVHTLLNGMAADNQAQSNAITEISVAMGTMDQATQQNAAMVEETSAAARNLSAEVDALANRAAQFKVSDGPIGFQASASSGSKLHFGEADEVTRQRLSAEMSAGMWN